MQCQKKKRDGKQCRALAEKQHCALHAEPGKAKKLGSKGGRRRALHRPDGLRDFAAPKNAADLRDLLAESIIGIQAGKLEPRVANALGYLGASYLRALEVSDVGARSDALEVTRERRSAPSCNRARQTTNRRAGDRWRRHPVETGF